jgi:hypothetical protein
MTLLETIEEVRVQTNTSFSAVLPGLQLAVDNSSLDAVKKCPRYYQYSIVEGYRGAMSNPHLTFGGVFAGAIELYARHRAEDVDHDMALVHALRFAITETWDFSLKRPWVSDEPTKTRNTLLRTIVWYLDKFQDQTLKTLILANGKPAVELSFRFDSGIEAGTGEPFLLCGHIDRVVEFNGEVWITDNKTTKHELNDNYFKQYTPNGQVSLYSIAGGFLVPLDEEIGGLIIDAAQVLVSGSRFRRQIIPRSEEQLEEYMQDLRTYLREMEGYARDNYWPMRETSCHWEGQDASGKYACQYLPVCSADPSIRQTLLDAMFVKRVWDPLLPR